MQRACLAVFLFLAVLCFILSSFAQSSSDLIPYFKNVGFSDQDIAAITEHGQSVSKDLKTRSASDIYVVGAVYINAKPDAYLKSVTDYVALRKLPDYLGVQAIGVPPKLSDFSGFNFTDEDIKDLKACKPGNCDIQLPEDAITSFRSAAMNSQDPADAVNNLLQKRVTQRVAIYQKQGNKTLAAVYNDKSHPVSMADTFKGLLSYTDYIPQGSPEFYRYLISYPGTKPANTTNGFYWTNVKFGLKPTLRILHVVTRKGSNSSEPAYIIAEKQLYASHYFQAALDLTYCISASGDPTKPGFYLIKLMGSQQAGLTGFKGSVVRKVAVDKTVASLKNSLASIKASLEGK